MNKILGKAMLSVFLGAGVASLAIGQTTTPNPTAPAASAPTTKSGHHWFSHWFSHATPTERVEARLTKVKGKLEITAAQQAQWDAYADVMRKTAQDREQTRTARHSSDQRPDAIERLERQSSLQAQAVTRSNELLAVEKPLYAALSPEQKKVADKVLNKSRGEHGHVMDFFSRHDHEKTGKG